MSYDIKVTEVEELHEWIRSYTTSMRSSLELLLGAIDHLTNLEAFQGEAANAVKAYFQEVHGHAITGICAALEELEVRYDMYAQPYTTTIDSSSSARFTQESLILTSNQFGLARSEMVQNYLELREKLDKISDVIDIWIPQSIAMDDGLWNATNLALCLDAQVSDHETSNEGRAHLVGAVTSAARAFLATCGASAAGGVGYVAGSALSDPTYEALTSAYETSFSYSLEWERHKPGAIYLEPSGQFIYISGVKINLEEVELESLSDELIKALTEIGLEVAFDLAALKIELDGKATAAEILHAVGIEQAGKYEYAPDGKIVFRDYVMADGAGKMTTRINPENMQKYARPKAATEAKSIEVKSKFKARGVKSAGSVLSFLFAGTDAVYAYDEAYSTGEGKPEDRRRSDAEAAVVGSFAADGAGALAGGVAGWAATGFVTGGVSTENPAGAVAGIVAGTAAGIVVPFVVQGVLDSDYDGDGQATQADIDEWWYNEGGHDAVDWAFNEYPEEYQRQLTHYPTGMARL